MEEKEKRVRAMTQIYYSRQDVQEAILKFSEKREVVPRYFEAFGKRPDVLAYKGDIMGLVKKGATSFHASEEIWKNPLELETGARVEEINDLREGWDLLIDIDSPFLDFSKIAARLIVELFEVKGIKNYGIKFSGSKGFHLIVSWKAFPKFFADVETKNMFPAWPRIICGYLLDQIRADYNEQASELLDDIGQVEKRTKISKDELKQVQCKTCGGEAKRGAIVILECPVCGLVIERKNVNLTKRRLKCLNASCGGVLEVTQKGKEYYFCENCKDPEVEGFQMNSEKNPENFKKFKGVNAEKFASLDLVLVAPRHLFRMPYSLHEKTSLASAVLDKNEIENFKPSDADAMKVKVREFLPNNFEGEATKLLASAIDWRKGREIIEGKIENKRYEGKEFEETDFSNVSEKDFPPAIVKLLNGLEDGKKRGLFVLLTFLRCLNFSPDYINKKIREWNEKNTPPLREGYVRAQIEWNFRQKKKILPPNYSNDAFYKDIGIIDKKPETKNPLVDVKRRMWGRGH